MGIRLSLGLILAIVLIHFNVKNLIYGYKISVEFDTDQLECADYPTLQKCLGPSSSSSNFGSGNNNAGGDGGSGGGGSGGSGSGGSGNGGGSEWTPFPGAKNAGSGGNKEGIISNWAKGKRKLVPPRIKSPLSSDEEAIEWVEDGINPKNTKYKIYSN